MGPLVSIVVFVYQVDNIELKKGVGCYRSDKLLVTTGKYSGQLVIDNDVTPVDDFVVTLLSEVVHLIAKGDFLLTISFIIISRIGR